MENYTRSELSPEEASALTKELQDVLAKYNCEMGVKSSIEIFKRVEIVSPLNGEFQDKTEDNSETKTEESGSGNSEEPAIG